MAAILVFSSVHFALLTLVPHFAMAAAAANFAVLLDMTVAAVAANFAVLLDMTVATIPADPAFVPSESVFALHATMWWRIN